MEGRWETANSRGMEGCIPDPDDDSDSEEREAARRSQLDTLLNVLTTIPSNVHVLLSVRAITTFINSPVGELCATNPVYSLSKLHSTSNQAMAQMEGQQVQTGHDWPPEQLGGHRVGLKHPLQWFVLQDVQGRWRSCGEKGSIGWSYHEISTKKGRVKDIVIPKNKDF